MSKFNSKAVSKSSKTVNRAGGEAYSLKPREELVTLLLTSFVNDKFYEKASDQLTRLGNVFDELKANGDAEFAAKAAFYARNVFGMRSISQALAANVAAKVSGENWTRRFFSAFPRRVDDVTELMSFYQNTFAVDKSKKGYARSIPNAMKAGLRNSLGKFDTYQLAKYRGENLDLSLVDVVNLLHPKPTDKNADALAKLVAGTLRSENTWENKVSAAGQKAETEEEATELKGKAFDELVRSRKIGYFALLKNLRNIMQTTPETIDAACEMLTDRKLIQKSLVFPFRFLDALDAIQSAGGNRKIVDALNKAMDISVENCPEFSGNTLVILDESGSMGSGNKSYAGIGSLFAAVIFKRNANADVMAFSDDARKITNLNAGDSVMSIAEKILARRTAAGTNFHAPFAKMTKRYDRLIFLSDAQGWVGYSAPTSDLANYEKKFGKTNIYSFDLAGYGDSQFSQERLYLISGFSDKVFSLMGKLEQDRNALIHEIEAVEF